MHGLTDADPGCCTDHKCSDVSCVKLPDGMTCANCWHLSRCLAFGFTPSKESRTCDFFPRRFLLVVSPNA